MNLPQRKNIRLQEYDYRAPGYYFVTICTCDKQRLFQGYVGADLCVRPPDTQSFLGRWLFELERKYQTVRIDTACIMPDHIHILVELTGGHIGPQGPGGHIGPPLQEIVQWYKTQTTNEYIRRVKTGELPPFQKRVWQRGYYEHIVRADKELNEIRQYILNNPLASKM